MFESKFCGFVGFEYVIVLNTNELRYNSPVLTQEKMYTLRGFS